MNPAERLHLLVLAAGTGSRAGTTQPKQYQILAGQALVVHTLLALSQVSVVDTLNVVVSPDDESMSPLLQSNPALQGVRICPVGGETRALSVSGGLQALRAQGAQDQDWVLVHDAARCLIQSDWVMALVQACRADAVGGLLAVPLPDTLKVANPEGRVQATLERGGKWLAQTPQMFRLGMLERGLKQSGTAVTDEASAMESLGLQPKLVVGHAMNIKVTYPEDFLLARWVLLARQQEGHG